ALDLTEGATASDAVSSPFLEFAQSVQPQSVLRAKITAAYRRPETECLPFLLSEASMPKVAHSAQMVARDLVVALREKGRGGGGGVEGLIHEYSLSSQEGVAL